MTLHERLVELAMDAAREGKLITVTQVSLQPYAMGHCYTNICVRDMRDGRNYMVVLVESENDCDNEFRQGNLPL